jgi:eukaryotic translation initiation factor 2C
MQTGRTEIIEELHSMATELFTYFKSIHKVLPKRLIFFRDGVSEGEMRAVVQQEIIALKKALTDLGGDELAVTFLSVRLHDLMQIR